MKPTYWRHFDSLVRELALDVSMLELRDGTVVHLYEAGPVGAPEIVIVSPSESPFLLMSRLFQDLARTFRVVAWDHPAGCFMDVAADVPPPTLHQMSRDLLGVIEARKMKAPHVVTWCSGALIALWALAASRESIASVTFIAPPSVLGQSPERTGFQSHFLQTILELASGQHPDEAALCRQILTGPRGAPLVTDVDRMIYSLTDRPVRDETALRRYAKSIQNACLTLPPTKVRSRDRAYVEIVAEASPTVPMCLLHCRDDETVSFRCSADVAARNDNIRLVVYPRGGHFVIYREPRMLADDIESFVSAVGMSAAKPLQPLRQAEGVTP